MSAMKAALSKFGLATDLEWVEQQCLDMLAEYLNRLNFYRDPRFMMGGEHFLKLSEWEMGEDRYGEVIFHMYKISELEELD